MNFKISQVRKVINNPFAGAYSSWRLILGDLESSLR